jgi:hypothetical protein
MSTSPLGIEERECQLYYETNGAEYKTNTECLVRAEEKAYEMFEGFSTMNIPFKSMEFGCEEQPV